MTLIYISFSYVIETNNSSTPIVNFFIKHHIISVTLYIFIYRVLYFLFAGIASSGGNCTVADEPSVFEDVSMYSDWIRNTMESAGYPYEY